MKYRWKTRPYRHQVAAVKQAIPQLRKTGGFALLMEPRTGKTKVAIDLASIFKMTGEVSRVVVIMPVGVMDVWIDEIRKHCPHRCRITVWDKKGRKVFDLPKWRSDVLDFVLVNYEAFSAPGAIRFRDDDGEIVRSRSRGGRFTIKKLILKWKPDMIILDESHRIKTPSSVKTRTIWSLAWKGDTNEPLCPMRLILTGTVMTKKKRVFDIWSQWRFVNRNSKLVKGIPLKEFKEHYAIWTQRKGFNQWLRNRTDRVDKLRDRLHAEAFAVTRDECYDLPPRLDPVILPVELEESAKYYDQMAEEMVAMLESGEYTWAKIPLVQRLRLAQIACGIMRTEPTEEYPEGRLVRCGTEKLRVLEDYCFDQFEADEKVIIGARFRGDIGSIRKLMIEKMKVPVWELHGGISRVDRTKNITAFRRHQGAGVFLAQPSAGSLGIDLSTSSTLIWYSMIDSWVDFTQFEDRIALSGRANRFVYLLGKGTVDELQYEALREDGDMARVVTNSPHRLLRNFRE